MLFVDLIHLVLELLCRHWLACYTEPATRRLRRRWKAEIMLFPMVHHGPRLDHSLVIGRPFECSVLWQGNPLSTVQTFGTPHCKLCSKERLEIYKRARYKRETLINDRTNLFEACNHKPSFHRYKVDECTDETQESRKGPAESNHRVLVASV